MIPTPHLNAKFGDFAPTVLMPGDPMRAKFIAENFLTDVVAVNSVRAMYGYTGKYDGTKVSVLASGMGMPSMAIYSHELYNFYGVENIIRVGSAGALSDGLALNDIVLAQSACTDSAFLSQYNLPGIFAPTASFELLQKAAALSVKGKVVVGTVLSSDVFYADTKSLAMWKKMGVMAVEMECAALYATAARAGKKALCICTISDCPFSGESLSSDLRERSFTEMARLALELAKEIK